MGGKWLQKNCYKWKMESKLLQMENGIYHAQTQRPDFEFSPNIEPGGWDFLQ